MDVPADLVEVTAAFFGALAGALVVVVAALPALVPPAAVVFLTRFQLSRTGGGFLVLVVVLWPRIMPLADSSEKLSAAIMSLFMSDFFLCVRE